MTLEAVLCTSAGNTSHELVSMHVLLHAILAEEHVLCEPEHANQAHRIHKGTSLVMQECRLHLTDKMHPIAKMGYFFHLRNGKSTE